MVGRGTLRLTVLLAVVAVVCLVGAIWAGSASVSSPGPLAGQQVECGTALTPSAQLDQLAGGGVSGGPARLTVSEPVHQAIEGCEAGRTRQQILEAVGAAVAVFLGAVVVLRERARRMR